MYHMRIIKYSAIWLYIKNWKFGRLTSLYRVPQFFWIGCLYLLTFGCSVIKLCRWNVSASGARPNPQGSFRYGSINVTEVYVLRNKPPEMIDGKRRATLSGISFVNPSTPIRLADWFKVKGAYKLDFPTKPLTGPPRMETSVINGTYRGFMEVILQNNDTKMHAYHMSGYAFFVVG